MSGRKRPPRGGGEPPPTRKTDATNRGEGKEADFAHFEALWHRKLAASNGRRDDGPQRKRRRRAPPKAGREDDTKKKKGGYNAIAEAGASAKGRGLRSPRDRWSQPLYQYWSIPQIDDLVGWATSHRGNIRETKGSGSEDDEEGRRLGLAHLPVAPPPPSHIAFLRHRIKERRGEHPPGGGKGKRKRNKTATGGRGIDGLESMSTSAHVATGMAVEEALTMALMPLAEAHVARCRRLQRGKQTNGSRKEGQPSAGRRDDDPFHAWTLPPAEAIAALAREGSAEGRTALTSLLGKHPDVVAKHASPTVAKEVAPKMEEDSSDGSGSSRPDGSDSESGEDDREEPASKEDASSDGHDSESKDEDKTPAADSSDSDGEDNDSDSSESGSEGEKSAAEEDASSGNSDGSGGSEHDSEDESENAQRY